MQPLVQLDGVSKAFILHLHEGVRLDVVSGVTFAVAPGECVVLGGPSGAGKSSLLKIVYGNYSCDSGRIWIRDGEERIDVANAEPRRILDLRRHVMGYVSQFLRVIPRVGALEIVAAAGREGGLDPQSAQERAQEYLSLLNVPERLWALPPATFSGGEQQRVNIARGLIADRPVLLLDEPTASLDARNRAVVVELIERKKKAGVAIVGIFHDEDVRDRVATHVVDVTHFAAKAA
ncbi:alpha-D-ribose 1-methylphosphonate 5-triphosphate synthase subunit PhnL [Microvirga flocculans]|uniref:Alpha-D-ribose 1-methylphosphonate 5-triphosphate synthase subunit PhnL n=1 Tax=Microvirga flocculans TaxID=217168 RepID=A0A7W6IBP3_9HYPH|nr:phosphonate C-P lyase system protein PhnL [Microvirga flocculans]MBB4038467.1 alpha-D-ribose 1-methylphosphonate 5-triphosphate synthase subunit PhnL [Microvirga flocculans]